MLLSENELGNTGTIVSSGAARVLCPYGPPDEQDHFSPSPASFSNHVLQCRYTAAQGSSMFEYLFPRLMTQSGKSRWTYGGSFSILCL